MSLVTPTPATPLPFLSGRQGFDIAVDGLKFSILMPQLSQLFGFSVPSGISFGEQCCFREFVHVNEAFNTQCTEAFLLLLNSQNIVYVIWILFEASFMCFLRIKSVTDTISFVKIILFYCVYTYVCMGGHIYVSKCIHTWMEVKGQPQELHLLWDRLGSHQLG